MEECLQLNAKHDHQDYTLMFNSVHAKYCCIRCNCDTSVKGLGWRTNAVCGKKTLMFLLAVVSVLYILFFFFIWV